MKKDSFQILIRPLVTEKGLHQASGLNQYPFEVHVKAGKADVRRAVEEIFGVRVRQVRTMMRKGKPRRFRHGIGHTRHWKKAVVTLVTGDSIQFV
jgi:large subunit ribosomal protein L23